MVRTKVVSSTRVPVSQGESLNDLAVTVESAPTSAYHLLSSAIQISHSVSLDVNKVSQCLGTGTRFLTRCFGTRTSTFVLVRSQDGDFRVTVASRVPDHHAPLPAICETCICLPRSYSCLFFTRDIANLKTTGQCTSAVVKVPESFCQFVEDFTIQVRPSRHSCGTCRSLFRSM